MAAIRPLLSAIGAALVLMLSATRLGFAQEIKEEALRQIGLLVEEKASRTPEQRKLSSSLVWALKRQRGDALFTQLPQLRTETVADEDGMALVDIDAEIGDALLREIGAVGAVVSAFPQFRAIRARLPLTELENLARFPAVRSIRPADRWATRITTEGDVAHRADTARVMFGVDGTGVGVGAMSDSVDELANLQGQGELPPGVTVLPGQSGNPGSSEGTALMEIIHDMAPGADLFFATGAGGQAQMAQNILDLQAAGCDIIVDDIFYFAEPVFQDGVIAQAVDKVFGAGTVFFSAAGNAGNLNDGEAGVFEGDYSGTALPTPLVGAGVSAHDYGGGLATNEITMDGPFFYTLQWADPQGAASNDYDLYMLNAAMTAVVGASTNTQNGTQNPFEVIDTQAPDDTGSHLVVVKFNGADRFFHLNTHRGRLMQGTDGQIFGHPAAVGALAVAAVQIPAGGGPFVGGAANPVEPFSSDGPRRIFFNADGTPVRQGRGAVSEVRQKPDVAAADGVMTGTPGFMPFFGTSASAPHAAGIAALFEDLFPSIPVNGAFDIFKSSALDIEAPGIDRDSGSGIIMGEQSLGTPIFVDGFESGDVSAWTK